MNITAPTRRMARIAPDAVAIIGDDHAIDKMTLFAWAAIVASEPIGDPILEAYCARALTDRAMTEQAVE